MMQLMIHTMEDELESLQEHLAVIQEQLDSVIRLAAKLPPDQQDEYWAVAKDLQAEIRRTRKQIEAFL